MCCGLFAGHPGSPGHEWFAEGIVPARASAGEPTADPGLRYTPDSALAELHRLIDEWHERQEAAAFRQVRAARLDSEVAP